MTIVDRSNKMSDSLKVFMISICINAIVLSNKIIREWFRGFDKDKEDGLGHPLCLFDS